MTHKLLFNSITVLTASMLAFALTGCTEREQEPKPNLLLIMIDTLRADHLGLYGYDRDTSPFMDTLAERSLVYDTAYSVANWTNPTIKTLFTGMPPQSIMPPARHRDAIKIPLPTELQTFAELAGQSGYRTHALVDHPGINARLHFDQGFDSYTMLFEKGTQRQRGWDKSRTDHVLEAFADMLDAAPPVQAVEAKPQLPQPFLGYLHVVYPHRPYDRIPGKYRNLFGDQHYGKIEPAKRQQIINAYDAQIRQTDDLVKDLFAQLGQRELLENTWVIITSDHGESFWEHGSFEHGKTFFDEEIRVPMLVVPPLGQAAVAERISQPVSNLDVFATLTDLMKQPMPEGAEGVSLAHGSGGLGSVDRNLYSTSPHSSDIHARAIISQGYKLHLYPDSTLYQEVLLFDLTADPEETRNLAEQQANLTVRLNNDLSAHRERTEIDREWLIQTNSEPDTEELEGLRSLGYIQ